jgi:hypothetical protein
MMTAKKRENSALKNKHRCRLSDDSEGLKCTAGGASRRRGMVDL